MEGEKFTPEEAMPEEKLEDLFTPEWDAAFEAAEYYKKNVEVTARQVSEETPLVTKLADGHVETTNVAHPGDYIVTNPGGEEYAIGEEKFESRYEPKEGEPGRYKAKGVPLKAVQIDRDMAFTAPWGEKMSMRAGSWIIDGGGKDRYGIAEQEFVDTYALHTPEENQS